MNFPKINIPVVRNVPDELEGIDIKPEMWLISRKKSKLSFRLRQLVARRYRRLMGDYLIIVCSSCGATHEWYGDPKIKSCPLCGEGTVKISKGSAI